MCRSHRLIVVLTLIYTCVSSSLFAADADNQAVIDKLKATVPRLTVTMDEKLGVARHIASPDSFLTGPSGIGKAVAKKALVGPHQAVRGFLNTWPSLFGGDATLLDDAVIIRDDVTERSGLHTVVWQQMLEGIPVHGGAITAHTTKRDELISIGSGFVPTPDRTAKAIAQRAAIVTTPVHTAADATAAILSQNGAIAGVIQVIQDLGGPKQGKILTSTEAKGDIRAELVWFPVTASDLRLAWDITLSKKLNGIMYNTVVDATSLIILNQVRLTSYGFLGPKQLAAKDAAQAQAPQPVKDQDKNKALAPGRTIAPDGNHVGTNVTRQNVSKAAAALSMRIYPGDSPDTVGHELVSPTIDTTASPNGWIDENKETKGNNVDAHLDLNSDNQVEGADLPRPKGTGTSTVTFDFPIDLTKAPSTYRNAAIVNLFYWCNFTHDRLYHYGFTESAGNFQLDNFKRGGYGDDAVEADAQDGYNIKDPDRIDDYRNNANMATPPDGLAPIMQMYIFTRPIPDVAGLFFNPDRDSALVAEVIVHEYVHGLTHRLIGGGIIGNMDATQSDGMGEGWSDFYALSLLNENDNPLAAYPVGSYLASDQEIGIRSQAYAIEPRPSVIKTGTNPPTSKNTMTFNDVLADTEVHATGTVWCQILWECRGEMITKYGATIGNELMLQLVTDGLKLTPNKPSFTDARDAIIRADSVANAGANTAELWRAFSKRGLGRSAMAGDSSNYDGVAESFENSDLFRVSNAAGLHSVGRKGEIGTFMSQGTSFTLENPGITNVTWSVSKKADWFTLSPTSGTLAAGAKINVGCWLNTAAYTKPLGTWHDTITFTDSTNNITVTRPVSVRLIPVYTVSSDVKVGNWIDSAGHAALNLADDAVSTPQTLPFSFPFYDENATEIHVGSNGLIGFNYKTDIASPYNFDLPTATNKPYYDFPEPTNMAAVMWQDLRPLNTSKVTIGTTGTTPNRKTVVTWTAVPSKYKTGSPYTFQVVLEEETGDIVMNYKEVQEADNVFGQGRLATVGIEEVSGQFADKFSFSAAKLQNNLGIRFKRTGLPTADNAPPTMATDPRISVALNAAGTKCSLTMLAADDGGEANLIYTWSESGSPTSLFNFSTNGNNVAKTTEVTFTHSGTFVITGTATDEHGLSVSRTVSVAVPTLLSSLVIAPDTVSIPNGESTDFDVSGFDQFGDLIPGQPTLVSWSETGPGTIDPNGRYTADGQGPFTIRAEKGTLSDTATVTVTNGIPRVDVPAAATPSPVTGTTATLSVTGVDDVDTLDLIYTWSTVGTVPAAVTFDNTNVTNGVENCVATFTKAGTYNLRVTIEDTQDGSVTSDVTVIVAQTKNPSLLAIDPRTITMEENTTQTFVARDSDQFGDPMTSSAARTVVWSTTLGSINAAGLFKAPSGNVNATVLATESGGLTATAAVTIFVPSSNNGRFGGNPTSDGNSCGIGALSAMLFLFLLIAFNFNRRRFN